MQSLLTYAIEIVFWAFVTAFLFDLIGGLFPRLPDIKQLPQNWEIEPPVEEIAPLPDPWLGNADIAVAPTPPTPPVYKKKLLLLPPAPLQIAPKPAAAPKRSSGRRRKIA